MENKYFICKKCGNSEFKSNLLSHEAKCKGRETRNLNTQNLNKGKNIFIFNNYKCKICGAKLKMKEKQEHLLRHKLEKKENREDNNQNLINNINLNDNKNININIYINKNRNIIRNIINRNINIIKYNNIHKKFSRRNNRNRRIYDDGYNYQIKFLNNLQFNNNRIIERSNSSNGRRRNNVSLDIIRENSLDDDFEGIDKITIENLPISKIKDINKLDEEKKKCLICLENFQNGEYTRILPCIHIFHSDCIKKWMKTKKMCPICKYKI